MGMTDRQSENDNGVWREWSMGRVWREGTISTSRSEREWRWSERAVWWSGEAVLGALESV